VTSFARNVITAVGQSGPVGDYAPRLGYAEASGVRFCLRRTGSTNQSEKAIGHDCSVSLGLAGRQIGGAELGGQGPRWGCREEQQDDARSVLAEGVFDATGGVTRWELVDEFSRGWVCLR
jgi:hypothetical protein